MIIDCIGCLHGARPKLEGGDLLIVTGDLTAKDNPEEYADFCQFIYEADYKKKIVVAGNHDNFLQNIPEFFQVTGAADYLCDSGIEFQGFKIWGSPWTTTFPGINPKACAFTVENDAELVKKWCLIPQDTDILITHSPSFGNLDITKRGESVGSLFLWMTCLMIRPKIHVFSHVHESYGNVVHYNGIRLVNCSIMNERYQPVNAPIRVVLGN